MLVNAQLKVMRIREADLQPEHLNALETVLTRINKNQFTNTTNSICKNDQVTVLSQCISVKSIPSDKHWRWNQTKSKKTVSIPDERVSVSLCKLIPRRRIPRTIEVIPSHKLWLLEIRYDNGSPTKFAAWCEKGNKDEPVLDIRMFSFLADFMDPEIANTIWPSAVPNNNCNISLLMNNNWENNNFIL